MGPLGGGDLSDEFGAIPLPFARLGPQAAISLRPEDAGDEALLLRWAAGPAIPRCAPTAFHQSQSTQLITTTGFIGARRIPTACS